MFQIDRRIAVTAIRCVYATNLAEISLMRKIRRLAKYGKQETTASVAENFKKLAREPLRSSAPVAVMDTSSTVFCQDGILYLTGCL